MNLRRITLNLFIAAMVLLSKTAFALGGPQYVQTEVVQGGFPLFERTAATILIDSNDWAGAIRAGNDLAKDIERVTGSRPEVKHSASSDLKHAVIIGTVGHSSLIDRLVHAKKIDVSDIAGKWESFLLQVVANPVPGVESALVIAGSDKRGTIYGIYDLSEQIGVSPWHFWGDVPAKRHDKLFVKPGKYLQGPPSVKYRGIFINDEAPALTEWVKENFGTVPGRPNANYGAGLYTNVFEAMLRIRSNYLWPAMWNNAFNEDDTNNAALADMYGIVMGTSHQEPMLRAQQEWDRGPGRREGRWDYNKITQRPVLHQFWREGVRRNKNFESIITMGLRAENDSGAEVGKETTEAIIGIQRQILAEEMNPDVTQIPQMWCLYKEVQSYYENGLRVPDDVTLLWAEDNWGNVRRLPTAGERHRGGGAGVYYHFDYHGGPRSYQWVNTSPIAKVWDQMSLAKQYGADRIWIVNVGHLNKGGEFPLEFFMSLAWDTSRWKSENLDEFTRLWAAREFGPKHSEEIAQLITRYSRFNDRRKPELVDANTYSLLNYREFESVVSDYAALAVRAQRVFDQLPQEQRDAFYGFMMYPIKACAELNAMYFAAAKNALHAQQGRASANDFATQTRALFSTQNNLAAHYNRVYAGGKWNHFMDQAYIGATDWRPPNQNTLNAVKLTEIQLPEPAAMGVAVEGSAETTGGTLAFDKFGQASRYVEVFNAGKAAFEYTATVSAPWIELSRENGKVEREQRIEASIDWRKAPSGKSTGKIEFRGAGKNFTVNVSAFNPPTPTRESLQGFVEADGYVSIEAEHYTKKTDAGANHWIKIPNYGHTLSGMRAEAPAEALATPGKDSPCLEYRMYLFSTGKVEVESIVGPTLAFMAGRPLRYAVSFDDEPPQVVTIVPKASDGNKSGYDWSRSVVNNCHKIKSTHTIKTAGDHTLKIWMVDPAVVLQKHIVNTGGLKPSYLGPPESVRVGQ
jgi:hypothetical protein